MTQRICNGCFGFTNRTEDSRNGLWDGDQAHLVTKNTLLVNLKESTEITTCAQFTDMRDHEKINIHEQYHNRQKSWAISSPILCY